MKPTAEMMDRAESLVERLREADMDGYDLNMTQAAEELAQALADEHERAMESAAGIAETMSPPSFMDDDTYAESRAGIHLAKRTIAAAIRAAAKGEK